MIDCVWFVASGCLAGQVDGLSDQVGYQMVWHDMHLVIAMRMILRLSTTHIHVAIRFIVKSSTGVFVTTTNI